MASQIRGKIWVCGRCFRNEETLADHLNIAAVARYYLINFYVST